MITRFRLASGLVLFIYVLTHLTNHAFLLISANAANAAQTYLLLPWRSAWVEPLLLAAATVHLCLAFWSLWSRHTLRVRAWEATQITSGFAIPFLLVTHLVPTRIAELAAGTNADYYLLLVAEWINSPATGIMQILLLVVVWLHACVGLHYWLRVKRWYISVQGILLSSAVALPLLAISGFVAAGNAMRAQVFVDPELPSLILDDANFGEAAATFVTKASNAAWLTMTLLILGVLALRGMRRFSHRWRRTPLLTHANGSAFRVVPGASILETLRANGVAHASVCGGRARCTTCRVRVVQGSDTMPAPSPLEAAALHRIAAPKGVRLACQMRPHKDLTVAPLLPASAKATDGYRHGGMEGREAPVAILFVDLRGSTRLGEYKLPFDVLFILNQFFGEMKIALTITGGHYAQFNGDGLMALFGLDGAARDACRDALRCGEEMLKRMDQLNDRLSDELQTRLKIGIGIHFGEAIVGEMGPPSAPIVSAIGDSVNTAARLEGLSKEHGTPLVVSEAAMDMAGIRGDPETRHERTLRGRSQPIAYYAFGNEAEKGTAAEPISADVPVQPA